MSEYSMKNIWSRSMAENQAIALTPSEVVGLGDVVSMEQAGTVKKFVATTIVRYVTLSHYNDLDDLVLKTASDGDEIAATEYTVGEEGRIDLAGPTVDALDSVYASYKYGSVPTAATETLTISEEEVDSGETPYGIVVNSYPDEYVGPVAVATTGYINLSMVNDFSDDIADAMPNIVFEEV